jgi:peptide/nickel transport system permease protein
MAKFIARRLLISIPTLIGISIVLFAIISLAPGDPFAELALNPNVPPEVRENLRKSLGIDDPLPVRYVRWATSLLRGDWGYSFTSRIDVTQLITQRLPTTMFIMGTAYVIAFLIAVPVGVIAAKRQYSWLDNLFTTISFIGFSLPTFFTGLILILIFSVKLDLLPTVYNSKLPDTGFDWIRAQFSQSVMPIMVLALFEGAQLTRYVRSSMLDVVKMDYVNVARSKGLSEMRVTIRHALRNALIPVVTIMALQLPNVFAGAIITEQIFRIPGIGSLLIDSLRLKDTPVVMGIVFTYAALVVLCNLLADILYGLLDPRIKYT